jgi:hypothetical protein
MVAFHVGSKSQSAYCRGAGSPRNESCSVLLLRWALSSRSFYCLIQVQGLGTIELGGALPLPLTYGGRSVVFIEPIILNILNDRCWY